MVPVAKNGEALNSKKFAMLDKYFLIRGGRRFRAFWDVLIILCSLINCFITPVDISFSPLGLEGLTMNILNWFIDISFLIDLFFNFRTTIWNPLTGEEIFDTKEIARQYIKKRFVLDLISSIPLDRII